MGSAYTVLLRRIYAAPIEDVWDAVHEPGAHRPLVSAGQRRPAARRQLPARGQRRRRDRRLRAAAAAEGHLGLRRDARADERSRRRGPPVPRRRRTQFELEHVADVDPRLWGQFGPGRGRRRVGPHRCSASSGICAARRGATPPKVLKYPAVRAFMTESSAAWGVAHAVSGAPDEAVASAVANTTAAYVPPLES